MWVCVHTRVRGLCVSVCFFSFEGCSSMPWKGKQWRTPPQFYTEAWGAWRSPDPLKTGSRVVTGSRLSKEWTKAQAVLLCHFLLRDLESVYWPLWSFCICQRNMIPACLTRLEVGSKGIHGCGVGEDTLVTRTPEAPPSGVSFSASMGWLMLLPQLCVYNLMFKELEAGSSHWKYPPS